MALASFQNLHELRVRARLSLAELAKRAGLPPDAVELAERGVPVPDADAARIVRALEGALGQNVDWSDYLIPLIPDGRPNPGPKPGA